MGATQASIAAAVPVAAGVWGGRCGGGL